MQLGFSPSNLSFSQFTAGFLVSWACRSLLLTPCCRLNQEKHNNFVRSLFTWSTSSNTYMLACTMLPRIFPTHTGTTTMFCCCCCCRYSVRASRHRSNDIKGFIIFIVMLVLIAFEWSIQVAIWQYVDCFFL